TTAGCWARGCRRRRGSPTTCGPAPRCRRAAAFTSRCATTPERRGGRGVPTTPAVVVLGIQLIGPLLCWALWVGRVAQVSRLASRHRDRVALYLAPPACLLVLALCFAGRPLTASDPFKELVLIGYAAGAWFLALAAWAFPWLGLSPRDDVAERRNRAAGWALLGAQAGLTLAYGAAAGAGGGAGWGFTPPGLGLLSILVLFALWGLLEKLAGFSEAITVERDGGSACRLAALLPALGLLVG